MAISLIWAVALVVSALVLATGTHVPVPAEAFV
jgi:hypothetical protein